MADAASDFTTKMSGLMDKSMNFSYDMAVTNIDWQNKGQLFDTATKVNNNLMNKPGKIETTQ